MQKRWAAEAAFECMGKLPRSSPALVESLGNGIHHKSKDVQIAALNAAASLSAGELKDELRQLLKNSDEPEVQIRAAHALCVLNAYAPEAMKFLNDAFADPDYSEFQPEIFFALEELGTGGLMATDALLSALHKSSVWVNAGSFKFDGSLVPNVMDYLRREHRAALPLMAQWLRSDKPNSLARERILKCLASNPTTVDVAEAEIHKQLKHANKNVVRLALTALSNCNDVDVRQLQQAVSPKFVDFIHYDLGTRLALARAVAKPTDDSKPLAVKVLRQLIEDANDEVAMIACRNHWSLCHDLKAITNRLERILKRNRSFHNDLANRYWEGEFQELLTMIDNPPPSFLRTLKGVIKTAADDDSRETAMVRLGCLGPMAFDSLESYLRHKDPQVRVAALVSLPNTRDSRAAKAIAGLLNDNQSIPVRSLSATCAIGPGSVREVALESLVDPQLNATSAIPQLLKLLDPDDGVSAVQAIQQTGHVSEAVLARLRACPMNEANTLSCHVAFALATLEPTREKQLAALKRFFHLIRRSSLSRHYPGYFEIDLPLLELARHGKRYPELDETLRFFVLEHEFLAAEHRVEAAYALAVFFPDEPRWREYLRIRTRGDYFYAADDRWSRLTTGKPWL